MTKERNQENRVGVFSNAPCPPCSGGSPVFRSATTAGSETPSPVCDVRVVVEVSLERPWAPIVMLPLAVLPLFIRYTSSPHMRQWRMMMCAMRFEKFVGSSDSGEGLFSVALWMLSAGGIRDVGDDPTETNVL